MRVLGLDGGIASVGWAILEMEEPGRVVAAGTWMFDAPENAKERTPLNAIRRERRGQRRVIRRRRQRMNGIRALFARCGLLPDSGPDALRLPGLDPWQLRAEGLDRPLSDPEFAAALGHIARHRGFRSNSKCDRGANAASDTSAMLGAIEARRERLAAWPSVGSMFARDPELKERRRNRDGDYSRTILRTDHEAEVHLLFESQRRLGNPVATAEMEQEFARLAFSQRPLQDSEHLVGTCPLEPDERRTAKRAPSFERFRLLSRLAGMKLLAGGEERRLSPEQIADVMEDFGRQKGVTYKFLRRVLDLDTSTRFANVAVDEEKRDVAARTGAAAEGTATLREAVGVEGWGALLAAPERLDRIAEVLTFREDTGSIRQGIEETGVDAMTVDALMHAVEAGAFGRFKGAAHLSAKAVWRINPYLARGLVYSDACAEAAYDHAARPVTALEDVRNPVARKALGQMVKQVTVLVHEYGLPELIHVELARDVGRSAEERDEITRGIENRNRALDKLRDDFREMLHKDPTRDELLRFELWKEQNSRCLYSDERIQPEALLAADNAVQVDHILPWSRFGDDSFANKSLCTAKANQEKRGRTPFEWFSADKGAREWDTFVARVEECRAIKGRKKRGFYLRRNAAEVEERFRTRNLNDTRYAARLLLHALGGLYPQDGRVHVRARPGALTAKLRRAWGLEGLKKDAFGQRREDDRHHALDSIVVAATTESMVQTLTRAFQETERQGRRQEFKGLPEPWPGFRDEARRAFEAAFVARAERRRARGEAHAATIRQVGEREGALVVFERRLVDKLTLDDLERVKDADRNAALVASLRAWIEAGKPKGVPPRSPKGDPVRKVRLATKHKLGVQVRGGTAERGEMVRVDVFQKLDRRGCAEYYLVPIYPHQVANRAAHPCPPSRAATASKPEAEWTEVDEGFEFLFSLYHNSLVEVTKRDGQVILGYFKGMNRSTAAISLASHLSPRQMQTGIGAKTLLAFRKLSVNRLGQVSEVKRETRTWHGEVCT